jgi:hypothetical protein
MTKQPEFKTVEVAALDHVTGGVSIGQINMGPPKYSAAWWDFVRAGGSRPYK